MLRKRIECGLHARWRQWDRTHARTTCREDGVGDGWSGGDGCRFARANRWLARLVDQLSNNIWNLRERQDGIALPVQAGDARWRELHFFFHGATQRLNHIAFDLVAHAVSIDDLPAVMCHDDPAYANRASRAIHRDLGNGGNVGLGVLVASECQAAPLATGKWVVPARAPRRRLKHRPRAWVIEIAQAEYQRVDA